MIHNIINAVPGTREIFWNTFKTIARTNPGALRHIMLLMSLYMHLGPFSRRYREIGRRIAEIDEGRRERPGPWSPTSRPCTLRDGGCAGLIIEKRIKMTRSA